MKTEIKFDGNKHIVVIRTPLSSSTFTQVTCLMSDEELTIAKAERPDLIFAIASDLKDELKNKEELPVAIPDDETKGITVKGMTLPHDLDALINHLFEEKV